MRLLTNDTKTMPTYRENQAPIQEDNSSQSLDLGHTITLPKDTPTSASLVITRRDMAHIPTVECAKLARHAPIAPSVTSIPGFACNPAGAVGVAAATAQQPHQSLTLSHTPHDTIPAHIPALSVSSTPPYWIY